jgi:hypothetical protein
MRAEFSPTKFDRGVWDGVEGIRENRVNREIIEIHKKGGRKIGGGKMFESLFENPFPTPRAVTRLTGNRRKSFFCRPGPLTGRVLKQALMSLYFCHRSFCLFWSGVRVVRG